MMESRLTRPLSIACGHPHRGTFYQDGPSLGTELTGAVIKTAMDAAKFNGIIDELAVSRRQGGLNFFS